MASPVGSNKETKTLRAQCFCKNIDFTIKVAAEALPLSVHVCHCSICRRVHGSFCVFHSQLPPGVAPQWVAPSSLDKLTRYRHATALSDRYFCSTCSCHIGDVGIDDGDWVISTSIFDANRDDVPAAWGQKKHFNCDDVSNGILEWLPDAVRVDKTAGGTVEKSPSDPTAVIPGNDSDSEVLNVKCHCGGVSFAILRPTPEMQADPEYKPWISPFDSRNWMAVMDVCDDCRLQSGVHVVPWTFVPKSRLSPAFPDDLRLGTSKTYASSEGTLRSFCGTCGATVAAFFGADGTRELSNGDWILDISCGLIRHPEGLLAEDWLTWRTGRLAHPQSGMRYDSQFTENLARGMAAWGRRRHGEARDFEVG
jgi:hypothetical protein